MIKVGDINSSFTSHEIEVKKFPAGESLVRLPQPLLHQLSVAAQKGDIKADMSISVSFQSNDDLINLLLVTDAIRRAAFPTTVLITLYIHYFPYARQDRVCSPGEPFSLKVVAGLINSQGYKKVCVLDPHSDVTGAVLDNMQSFGPDVLAAEIFCRGEMKAEDTFLVSPDAGAAKKVYALAKQVPNIAGVICANKQRDPKTGAILKTEVPAQHIGNKSFLIVDDICDGGRTFLELAKALRPYTEGNINLYVTHGIFSNGINVFEGVLDKIFTLKNVQFNTYDLDRIQLTKA